jgi:hypothetical protein
MAQRRRRSKAARPQPRTLIEKLKQAAVLPPKVETPREMIGTLPQVAPNVPRDGHHRMWTSTETAVHEAMIEQLMLGTHSPRSIERAMRERYDLGANRTGRLIERVRRRWLDEGKEAMPSNKEAQIRRLERYIQLAQGVRRPEAEGGGWKVRPEWSAIGKFEALLADLLGTRAPIEIAVSARISTTAMNIISSLSPEELTARLDRARERKALAQHASLQVVGVRQ